MLYRLADQWNKVEARWESEGAKFSHLVGSKATPELEAAEKWLGSARNELNRLDASSDAQTLSTAIPRLVSEAQVPFQCFVSVLALHPCFCREGIVFSRTSFLLLPETETKQNAKSRFQRQSLCDVRE